MCASDFWMSVRWKCLKVISNVSIHCALQWQVQARMAGLTFLTFLYIFDLLSLRIWFGTVFGCFWTLTTLCSRRFQDCSVGCSPGRSCRVHCSSSEQLLRMGSATPNLHRRWPWEIHKSRIDVNGKSSMFDWQVVYGNTLEHIETIWNHAWK